ncbi:hypothetical protein MUK42_18192 [Musa troglodytarum]|uniref:Uncharacterized protein n=1 Tax=Musa troglodytarum TaxID=320322 RepID=A0A9E7H2Z1_9LILI|nr:hypothetical protein MUK42_18192 [Musa troglodytarum]
MKVTTAIVGLVVVPGPWEAPHLPRSPHTQGQGYREAVDDEILTRCRLKVCREEGDREAVEKRLGFGQSWSHGVFLKTMNMKSLKDIWWLAETMDGRLIWNQVRIIHQVLDLCDLIRLGLYLSGVHGDLSLGLSQLTLGDTDLPLQHRYHPNTPDIFSYVPDPEKGT